MNNSKLTIKRDNSKTVPFEELSIGEVFTDLNLNSILMKIESLELPGEYSVTRNAIDLETGYAYYFEYDDRVFRFKATLMED